jgi:hypothetical protein
MGAWAPHPITSDKNQLGVIAYASPFADIGPNAAVVASRGNNACEYCMQQMTEQEQQQD